MSSPDLIIVAINLLVATGVAAFCLHRDLGILRKARFSGALQMSLNECQAQH